MTRAAMITLDPDSWDVEQPEPSGSSVDLGSVHEIEEALSRIPRMIDAALAIYRDASELLPDLKRTLRLQYADAFERHASKGSPRARLQAEKDVRAELYAIDVAKMRVEVASKTVQVLQDQLSAAQTRANFIMAQMRLER